MTENRRVLITGLSGFTGRYLANELAGAGFDVYGVGSHPDTFQNYSQVGLDDKTGLRRVLAEVRPAYIVHLAAIAFVGHGDANAFYQVNLIGSRNLLEALAESGLPLRSVLLASSANIYGNAAGGVLTEGSLPNPANDYAVSKYAMELMAKLWIPRLPITIARPFNYTGVGQSADFLLPKIVGHFRSKAAHMELGNLDVWRDFSDVRAVVNAYRRLLERAPVGAVVNVCSGNLYSLREVVAMATQLSGHRLDVRVNPAFVRANEVKSLCGDASCLRSIIGDWSCPPLSDTLSWMLEAPVA
ncbi:GDP-mannose 4,6-dehydratase [Niveibacterium sp. 24ML]|uniref:NAD-dependent epimerase/dehydratase family protein n=1 Tax=Niveibacterium sp. 24ML TaxID=2985512 RepID=UPI00226FC973|nr:NAD-dependent epimerase/dehydratase family protein [Niveibacterium sp. 24ML]MCX9158363.1 GDP-mannose 4,6-dehydratase [Niveibacterium sp. 24ML]